MYRYSKNKKTFLKSLFITLAIVGFGFAVWAVWNYLFFSPESNTIAIGSVRQFQPDSVVHKTGEGIFIVRDHQGIYALSAICPHLGCTVKPATNGFLCPCHKTEFSKNGDYVTGPAKKGLGHYYIYKDQSNNLVVDLTKPVTREFRYSE